MADEIIWDFGAPHKIMIDLADNCMAITGYSENRVTTVFTRKITIENGKMSFDLAANGSPLPPTLETYPCPQSAG